jgi:hypothetical protein
MSVSKSRRFAGERIVVRQSQAAGTMIRKSLLCSTALVAASLASAGAMAQSIIPSGGGTVSGSGTYTDNTGFFGGYGGVRVTNTQSPGITMDGVSFTNSVSTPTTNAFQQIAAAGQSAVLFTNVANNLTATASGGAALDMESSTANLTWAIGQFGPNTGDILTGSYGARLRADFGFINVVNFSGSTSYIANGSALTGFDANSGGSINLQLGAPNISGFNTGISANSGGGINIETTGGAITGAQTGIDADASADITMAIGSDITAAGIGIRAETNGAISIEASGDITVVPAGTGIYASSALASGNTIDVSGSVTGFFGIDMAAGGFTTTIAEGATVTGTGSNSRAINAEANSTVINHGSILTTGGNSSTGIRFATSGTVVNTGVINAATLGGPGILATQALTVTNSGSISSGSFAVIGGAGSSITNLDGGVISGANRGIRLQGAATVDLQSGSTTNGIDAFLAGGARNVTIAGALTGAYTGGFGVDTITLTATGSMTSADLSAGNNIFNWQGGTISGVVNGGAATDTFNSNLGAGVAGSLSLNSLAGFEMYAHNSGNLTLTGSRTGGAGWHLIGGTLTLDGSLTNTGVNGLGVQTAGVTIDGANTVLNVSAGSVLWAQTQNAVQVNFVENITVNNAGTIGGGTGFAGIRLNRSGTINNNAGGLITSSSVVGATGISNSGAGVVVNNASGATITGNFAGIDNAFGVEATAPGLVVNNSGSITSFGANSAAIRSNSGTLEVINNAGGTISSFQGISITGGVATINNAGTVAGSTGPGIISAGVLTLTNDGTISGAGTAVGTAGIVLSANSAITNNASGQISGAIGIRSASGVLTLTNHGTVTGTDALLAGVDVTGTGSVLTNYGMIEGGAQAIVLNNGGTVYNYGPSSVLRATNADALSDASAIYSNGALTLTNEGTISTASTDVSHGIQVLGVATITNTGTITAASASGITFTGGGSSIINSGTITGGNSATLGYGIQGSAASGVSTITNEAGGLISGGTGGILLNGAGAVIIDLQAGSTTGAISSTGAGARTVTLSGLLDGGYNAATGTGANTFNLQTGGVVNGNVAFGSGTNVFNWTGGTISGTISSTNGSFQNINADLGAGNSGTLSGVDRLFTNLNSGNVTLTGLTNTVVRLQGGNLIIDTDVNRGGSTFGVFQGGSASTATINAGRTVTDAGMLVASTLGTINNNGTLTSSLGGFVFDVGGVPTPFFNYLVSVNTSAVVTNAGVMQTSNLDYSAAIQSGGTLQLNNTGRISGGAAGSTALAYGLRVTGGTATVTNTGAGSILTGADAAINVTGGILNLTNEGLIAGTTTAIRTAGSGAFTLNNSGTIGVGSVDGAGVYTLSGSGTAIDLGNGGTITNSGTITGSTYSIVSNGGALTVSNDGLITGLGGAIYSADALSLTNSGTIRQTSGGGAAVTLVDGGTILNNASGVIEGFDLGLRLVSGATTVTNAGSITGGANDAIQAGGALTLINTGAISSGAYSGVRIDGGGSVTNAGAITGGSDAVLGYGVQVNGSASTFIANLSGGLITGGTGAILLRGDGNTTIDLQAGSTTTGAITATGTGANQVLLRGTLNGDYSGGAGVDTINLYTTANGAFSLDGGAGTGDAVNFESSGDSIRSGSITNFEVFRFGGTGTVTLTGTYSGVQDFFVNSGTVSVSSTANMGGATGVLGLLGGTLQTTASFTTNRTVFTSVLTGQPGRIDIGAGTVFGMAGNLGGDGDLIVTGAGTLNLLASNTSFSGDIFVDGSALRAGAANAFGTGTVHLINPTLIYGASGAYANNLLLEVQSPASGDPSTLRTEAGVTATLTGSITQGAGAGVDPVQPLVIDGPGRIVLTNTANLWTGTTTINAGATLQGAANTISGSSVIANGVLHLLQPAAGTFTQDISGGGNVLVSGLNAGQALTLSGALTNNNGVQVLDGSALTITGSVTTVGGFSAITLNSIHVADVTNVLTNSGAISGLFAISATGNLDLANSGSITASITDFNSSGIFAGGTGTVLNTGSITSGTNVLYTQGAGSVTNSGLIRGGGAASTIRLVGANSSVTNLADGEIMTTGTGIGVFLDGINGSVINAGTISGGNAIRLVQGGAVTNSGILTGANGSGLIFQAASSLDNQASGSIMGATNGVFSTAGLASIINAGSILGSNGPGLNLLSGGTVTNTATGQITGTDSAGVFAEGGALNLINEGSVVGTSGIAIATSGAFDNVIDLRAGSTTDGSVTTGTGADTLIVAGAINGHVSLGGGDDSFTLVSGGSVTGIIDGGAGTDAFILGGNGNASFDVTQAVNFESRAMNGAGTWTLTGTDAFDLAWTVNAGVLAVSGGSAIYDAAGVIIAGGATLALLDDETIGSLAGSGFVDLGSSRLTLAGAHATDYAGVISGTGGLTIGSGYGLTLSGANTYTGTTIVDGMLTLAADGVLAGGSSLVINTAGLVDLQGFDQTVNNAFINGTLNGTGTLTAGEYQLNGATVNANLGTGDLFNIGGVSTLNGASGAGMVVVQAGTLTLGASDRLADTATVSVTPGAVFNIGAFNDTIGLLGLAGTLNGTGKLTADQYQLNGATVNANLGTGDLFNIGGVSTLNGASGAQLVSIAGGTLVLGASDRLSDTGTVVVGAGAVLDLTAFDDLVGLLGLSGSLNGTGTLTAAEYQLNGAILNANLGTGNLFNTGGLSILNGTSGAGNVMVQAGTLRLGASDRLSDTATVSVATDARFDLSGFDERIEALFGTGDVDVGAGRLTLSGAESVFGGRLSGSGSLVHTGQVFTLMGDHTIRTIHNAGGELRFLGTTTGNLTVTGGSLTGAGTIGGALTASNGAVISPGIAGIQNGIGSFVAGGLTLNGATLAIDVLGQSGGNLIDQLRITGTANLAGGVLAPTFQGEAADFNFSTRYLFLQADHLVGRFTNGGGFTAAAQEGLFWRIRYDLSPGSAVLELRELTNFDPGATGSGNQRAIGQALNTGQLEASDDFGSILSLFAGLDDAERIAALDSISGEPLAGMTTSMFGAHGNFLTIVRDRVAGGQEGGGTLNLTNGPASFAGGMNFPGNRESAAGRVGNAISAFNPLASATRGAGGWVAAYAADETLQGKPGTADVDSRATGFAGGYGVRRGSTSIGAAAGFTQLEGEVTARQANYESDLWHAAAYMGFDDGVWAADVTVSLHGGDVDSRRGVRVGAFEGQASGTTRTEGQTFSASVARRFQVSDNTMIALGAMGTTSSVSIEGFTETGAGGLSLEASALERDWQTLQISARGTQDYRIDGRPFRVYAGAGLMSTSGDRHATGTMRLSGAPAGFGAFITESAETPPVAGLADVGFEADVGDGFTLSAGYRGVFSERLRSNQFGLTLRASW